MDSQKDPVETKEIETCPRRPWRHKNGKRLSDQELRIVSKKWDEKTWEAYLKSIETPSAESLMTFNDFKKVENLFYLESEAEFDETTHNYINYILSYLTAKQREVITLYFWEGQTLNQIADHMNLYWTTVQGIRDSALKKIEKILSNTRYSSLYKSNNKTNNKPKSKMENKNEKTN